MCVFRHTVHEQLRLSALPCLAVVVSCVRGAQTLVEASEQIYKHDSLLWLIISQ